MALKILLADDSMTAQNMGKKILTDAGYDVVAVSNGAAAVKKIAEISPHLCILDIYMPGYTGLEVCEKVKGSSVTARMPVLLTVGKMEPYKPEEGARVRADGVIVKPFEASELLRAVQRFSQRIGAAQGRPGAPVPPPSPSSTQGTYERTVKLTREQIQEIMDPSLARWNSGTNGAEVVANAPSRIEVPVEVANVPLINVEDVVATTKMASTADTMPTFAAQADIEDSPVAVADAADNVIMSELSAALALAGSPTASLSPAAAVLPGFVDYLVSSPPISQTTTSAEEIPSAAVAAVQAAPALETAAEPAVIHSVEGVRPTGVEILSDELSTRTAQEIPAVDPSLEVAPNVTGETTPDPQFEAPLDLPVENATEVGLQPTSRAEESAGVVTTTDPNLAPMDGLIDAVQPLEGGRLVVPEPEEQPAAIEALPVLPPEPKGDVTAEISAVLDLLGQTISTEVPTAALETPDGSASGEEGAPIVSGIPGRVWMAEEVALSDSEGSISLMNEMRVANAATAEEPQLAVQTATALAEEPVPNPNSAPNAGMPEGGSPPDSAASPTQQLAAAMAAAFGGALPQEDLDRAEETQSISEEVRRFALGDAFKAKPGFSGAAIDDSEEKPLGSAKLAAAISRALDRIKPQLVAEILKELQAGEKKK